MNETQINLIAEQLRHALDLMQAEVDALRAQQEHDRALASARLEQLEVLCRDHETRLRSATDGVVQFKVWSGLASGSSGLLSLAALLKAFLGG